MQSIRFDEGLIHSFGEEGMQLLQLNFPVLLTAVLGNLAKKIANRSTSISHMREISHSFST